MQTISAFTFRGGEAPPFDGEVLVYDPPRVLAYRWATDVLRWAAPAAKNRWPAGPGGG